MNYLRPVMIFMALALSACGMEETSSLLNDKPELKDKNLLQLHGLLVQGHKVGECSIQSNKTWNGERYGLQVTVEREDEEIKLHFYTSNHITSRVKIKNHFFTSKVRSVSLQKVDIHSVPLSKKENMTLNFDRSGKMTSLSFEEAINNQWNKTKVFDCKN